MKLFICLILVLSNSAFAASKKLECPQAIFVTPKETLATGALLPEGWNPRTENIRRELSGATLYDGRPEEKASLVPDKQNAQGAKAVWTLNKENKNGYWLECRYVLSPTVISKKVPDEATQCNWTGNRKEETVSCD